MQTTRERAPPAQIHILPQTMRRYSTIRDTSKNFARKNRFSIQSPPLSISSYIFHDFSLRPASPPTQPSSWLSLACLPVRLYLLPRLLLLLSLAILSLSVFFFSSIPACSRERAQQCFPSTELARPLASERERKTTSHSSRLLSGASRRLSQCVHVCDAQLRKLRRYYSRMSSAAVERE